VSEHTEVPGFGNAFGKYLLIERLDELEVGEAHIAKLVGVGGFEKQVVIWCVGETSTHVADLAKVAMLEAARGASLSHANLAQVLDVGAVDGVCFVATEHVSGQTLEEVLRVRETLPWPVAAHIAGEVAAALCYAHGRRTPNGELLRLVHRRLAPCRIALSSAGDVKVTGFGTSWAWPPLDEYRSPEEARGEPVDGRADVFALGAILHRCLPRTGVPQALRDAVERALQPYPEYRPAAAELQQDLVQILHGAERPVAPRDLAEIAVATATFRR
jgi:serine/threonine-protein kinase